MSSKELFAKLDEVALRLVLASVALSSSLIGVSVLFGVALILWLWGGVLFLALKALFPKSAFGLLELLTELFVYFIFAVGVSRYLWRLDPLRINCLKLDWAASARAGIVLVYAFALVLMLPEPRSYHGEKALRALTVLSVIAFSLRERYASASPLLKEPFILFLRGFGTLADRSVGLSVLNAIPAQKRVALVIDSHGGTGHWDPLGIGYAGFKLFTPFRSMPLYLAATDADWVFVVRTLIARADSIVLDLSLDSPSIRKELSLIVSEGRMRDTILLEPESNSVADNILREVATGSSEEPRLRWRYRMTWLSGILRWISGSALLTPLLFISGHAVDIILHPRLFEIIVSLVMLLFASPFFFKPLAARDLQRELTRALSSARHPSPMQPPRKTHKTRIPLLDLIGEGGQLGVFLSVIGLISALFFLAFYRELSLFWRFSVKPFIGTTLIAGVLCITRGACSVPLRRKTRQIIESIGGSIPEARHCEMDFRLSTLWEWIKAYHNKDGERTRASHYWALLVAATTFFMFDLTISQSVILYLMSLITFQCLALTAGRLAAGVCLFLDLSAVQVTSDELYWLLTRVEEVDWKKELIAEDLHFVLFLCAKRRKLRKVQLARVSTSTNTVIARIEEIENFRLARSLWFVLLLALSVTSAILFNDPWAAVLGAAEALGYGLLLSGVLRFFKLHALRRELLCSYLSFKDFRDVLDALDQGPRKNKSLRLKCRKIVLRAAVLNINAGDQCGTGTAGAGVTQVDMEESR